MKRFPGIRYSFRPRSYWDDATVGQAVLRDVKGTRRRQLLTEALANGQLDRVDDELQAAEVSEETRTRLGRLHPSFMGGEYLPGYDRDETEIARIQLQSTTSDVISIRARQEGGVIHYRVVDEYGEKFRCHPESSRRPFTLGEFIRFIDHVSHPDLTHPFSLAYNELNANSPSDRRDLRHFTRISSDLYPGLSYHYERVFEDWVREADDLEGEKTPE